MTRFSRSSQSRSLLARGIAVLALAAIGSGLASARIPSAAAQTPPPPPAPAASTSASTAPDESILGVVPVSGSGALVLPKLAVMPILTRTDADSVVQLVVRRDLDLSGQFEVADASVAPPEPMLRDSPFEAKGWRAKGIEIVVRVLATPLPSGKTELAGEAFFVAKGNDAVFTKKIDALPGDVRVASHRMTDALLGALTGRPGGFASQLAYTGRVGSARQIFLIDADGFNLRAFGPTGETALAPTFGPGGEVYYALSRNYSPFRLVHGAAATEVPLSVPGSVYGIAFNADRSKIALSIMHEGASRIFAGPADASALAPVDTPPLANHPAFGPLGKLAYVAGSPVQRAYVDRKPVSPSGFHASAPVLCDTPQGLLVVFTVGVGAGADLVATDTGGGGIMRLTQNQGANTYAACSPDGRLVAFFSTGRGGKGRGLYIAPLSNPGRAKRISDEIGQSLRWEALP